MQNGHPKGVNVVLQGIGFGLQPELLEFIHLLRGEVGLITIDSSLVRRPEPRDD
jgi:hypothetical protein